MSQKYLALHVHAGNDRIICPLFPIKQGIYSNGECTFIKLIIGGKDDLTSINMMYDSKKEKNKSNTQNVENCKNVENIINNTVNMNNMYNVDNVDNVNNVDNMYNMYNVDNAITNVQKENGTYNKEKYNNNIVTSKDRTNVNNEKTKY